MYSLVFQKSCLFLKCLFNFKFWQKKKKSALSSSSLPYPHSRERAHFSDSGCSRKEHPSTIQTSLSTGCSCVWRVRGWCCCCNNSRPATQCVKTCWEDASCCGALQLRAREREREGARENGSCTYCMSTVIPFTRHLHVHTLMEKRFNLVYDQVTSADCPRVSVQFVIYTISLLSKETYSSSCIHSYMMVVAAMQSAKQGNQTSRSPDNKTLALSLSHSHKDVLIYWNLKVTNKVTGHRSNRSAPCSPQSNHFTK